MNNILKDENNSNYIKRQSAYNEYKDRNINNDLIRLYFKFNHLKNIYRQGWIKGLLDPKDAQGVESVADHSWSVAMLAISIIEKYNLDYDITKCMKLAIIHELGEIYAGDFTPIDNISKETKHEIEKKALEKLLEDIPFENDFLELWEEFENEKTAEAQFIRQIDISHMKHSLEAITLPYLKEMIEELKELTKDKVVPFCLRENDNK